MSLGTNVKSSMLSTDTLVKVLTAFQGLPQYNFVWKFEADELPITKPDNVYISKYLPQNDILGHPNIKAFISHCGLMSFQESMWHGKPLICIPFFGDQFRNSGRAIHFGAAVKLNFQDITVENLKQLILEVLENSSYTENAERISKNFRDKSEKPLERAIWWIEYVLRNPNLDHLRSPTLELGYFVSNGYDVFCFVGGMSLLIVFVTLKTISILLKPKKFGQTKKKTN
jgi:glucuronosyltransferase